MVYTIKKLKNIIIKNPILIEGLPGIGNVGKIATDFIVDNLKAQKIYEISSYNFPHAVFVNEKNLVELPKIEIYHKKVKEKDILLLAGDIQPIDEASCYEFCDKVLDLIQKFNAEEIITIGGIGMQQVPKSPKVYCTANEKSIIKKYRTKNLTNNIYGIVGPIIGASGLLVGLARHRKIPAIALLAETYGHPGYFGVKGAKAVLTILNEKLGLKLDLNTLNKEIVEMEKDSISKSKELMKLQQKKLQENKKPLSQDYFG